MIRCFLLDGCAAIDPAGLPDCLPSPAWIDLLHPDRSEELLVERLTGAEIPTVEEMAEIEISSRLYREGGATYATVLALANTDLETFQLKPLTLVLAGQHFVTVRYHEPRAVSLYESRLRKEMPPQASAGYALVAFLEALVDRLADIIERIARDIDACSARIFGIRGASRAKGQDFGEVLVELGRHGDLASAIRDSLATIDRATGWLQLVLPAQSKDKVLKEQLKTLARDVRSLADHTGYLSQKITFLLDATLGLVNIEQNNIIKIFSIVAVVFLPPTLVASIYGMNFEHMPELQWLYGYPAAVGAMIASAILPLLYFKRRGWL